MGKDEKRYFRNSYNGRLLYEVIFLFTSHSWALIGNILSLDHFLQADEEFPWLHQRVESTNMLEQLWD